MQTVPQPRASDKPTFGRKAYGAHRAMTAAQKARNVAASIRQREQDGRSWGWNDYGIATNLAQQTLVLAALAQEVVA
jgi:hypothetical protein